MNYFIDTEFVEGKQDKTFFGFKYGETKPVIDLISIALVPEDDRTPYYAISKDFNLKEAWNRWQQRTGEGDRNNTEPRVYWLRDNVLKPIYNELASHHICDYPIPHPHFGRAVQDNRSLSFTYKNLKWLIAQYGKTNHEIANEICEYIYGSSPDLDYMSPLQQAQTYEINDKSKNPIFYGYFCDFDWVCFNQLFGKMTDLPNGFPMYCIDLKQTLDEVVNSKDWYTGEPARQCTFQEKLEDLKKQPSYPKLTNEHNCLADAKWNKELHKFLESLK